MKIGAGMVAGTSLLANAAGAQDSGGSTASTPDAASNPTLQNPVTQYHKPPFPEQSQPWPGLSLKMNPQPNYGETTYKGSGKLQGRRALITGGDSGIGRGAAIAFAKEGADVAFNFLPAEEPDAREVVAAIQRAGRKAVPLPGDIRGEAFCKKLVSDAVRELGGLDIVVSNAARQVFRPSIEEISTEQFDDTFRTNVYAMFWIVKAAMPHLRPGSTIICTTSINAFDPSAGILDYAMTKGAIAIFVKGLAKQITSKGIRINGVAPGPIWTPLQVSGGQSMENLVSFGENTPMKRPGQPAELAATYVLLASDESSYMSGEIVGITGGRPL